MPSARPPPLLETTEFVDLARLQIFFATSPAARLLRSPHAAQIVAFLHRQFKESGEIVRPQAQLVQQLGQFQEALHETDSDTLKDRPESYLTAWSTGESRWLRRFLDAEHNEPVYELTPHTEDVLQFLGDVLDRSIDFIGTESRLKRIIDTLSDIVVRGSADPERRLLHLRSRREEIDREIHAIESGESVDTYSPTAIRERFADALSDLTSLQGDFRAVEESFKTITRDVQQQQSAASGSRGEILGFALDAEHSLKSQDQGVSFDEFVRLVLSPAKQEELAGIVARLQEIEALKDQTEGTARIHHMMASLSHEAEKVLKTIRRLSATLRRLLDSQATRGRLRLTAVLREIRAAAVARAEDPVENTLGVNVYAELELGNVAERPFWTAPEQFDPIALTDEPPDSDDAFAAFRHLAELRRLDWHTMRRHIDRELKLQPRITLQELIDAHPPESGAIGVLGYIQLAHDDGHEVDPHETQTIRIARDTFDQQGEISYEAPRVTFVQGARRTPK